MKKVIAEIFHLERGLLSRADYPELRGQFDWLVECGEIVAPLPGVLALPQVMTEPSSLLKAAVLWGGRDTVVTGWAAARQTFWPKAPLPFVSVAVPGKAKASRPGWRMEQRPIPAELIVEQNGTRFTNAALTAVDLACERNGGDIIDRALRSRLTTLDAMHEAFGRQPGRRGNHVRADLLHDSRDKPWSEAEREAHRLLRGNGITGWDTNRRVTTARGGYDVDILFEKARVILEIDGWEYHKWRESFEADRMRRNHLSLSGYTVLNFTWRQLTENPEWVLTCVREALGI